MRLQVLNAKHITLVGFIVCVHDYNTSGLPKVFPIGRTSVDIDSLTNWAICAEEL